MLSKIRDKVRTDLSGFIFGKLRTYKLGIYSFLSTKLSNIILRLRGVNVGKKCKYFGIPTVNRIYGSKITIGSNCTFRSDKGSNLVGLNRKCIIATFEGDAIIEIGENSGFSGTVIGAVKSIIIGNNVLSGANVLITDFDWHPIDPVRRHTTEGVLSAPIVIEDNVWLGINTVVLKGVTIGKNSVIGANSLVVKDIPANVIAAGNPCKVIKKLD